MDFGDECGDQSCRRQAAEDGPSRPDFAHKPALAEGEEEPAETETTGGPDPVFCECVEKDAQPSADNARDSDGEEVETAHRHGRRVG